MSLIECTALLVKLVSWIIKYSENASVQDLSRTGLLRPFRGKNA